MDADSEKAGTDEVVGLLRELVRWTRAMARPAVREQLERALPTEGDRIVYELTDGSSSTEIAKACGVSQTTVSRRHRKWEQDGIVEEVPDSGGKRCKLFALSELGMSIAPPQTVPGDTPVDEEDERDAGVQ